MSNRQKKRTIVEGTRALRAKPGWDPAKFQIDSLSDRLRQGMEDEHVSAVLVDADSCEACLKARSEQNDPGALCLEHLRKAMGL
jgi:hypothetical protein